MSMRMVTLTFSVSHVGAGAEGRNEQDRKDSRKFGLDWKSMSMGMVYDSIYPLRYGLSLMGSVPKLHLPWRIATSN